MLLLLLVLLYGSSSSKASSLNCLACHGSLQALMLQLLQGGCAACRCMQLHVSGRHRARLQGAACCCRRLWGQQLPSRTCKLLSCAWWPHQHPPLPLCPVLELEAVLCCWICQHPSVVTAMVTPVHHLLVVVLLGSRVWQHLQAETPTQHSVSTCSIQPCGMACPSRAP